MNISFTISSLIFTFLLVIVFFSKERLKISETSIFAKILVCTLIGSTLELTNYGLLQLNFDVNGIIYTLSSKSILVYYIVWESLFSMYVNIVTNNEKINKYYKWIILGISLVILFLPLNYLNENGLYIPHCISVWLVYMISIIYIIFACYLMISNWNKTNKKKFIPLLALVIGATMATAIQLTNPTYLLMLFTHTIIVYILYFTIENPDLKMIKELELAKTQAEKANRAKTDFLSNMSHEIRTPLNAIVGFSELMMKDNDLGEQEKDYAKDIVDASHNLLEIVNGILDISKIEANKMEVVEKTYDPTDVFNSLATLVKPRIGEKPIEFEVDLAEDLPGVLKGDVNKVKQIVLNILTNAAKYTDKGKITFSVSCVNDLDKKESLLLISVKDTGRGIKEEKISKLFDKFERLDEDRNTTIEGTGLGLAITKSLTELLGGKISVISNYGVGSTFKVSLKQEIVSMERTIKEEVVASDSVTYKGKKLLIVDDSLINIKVAENLLKQYEFNITSVTSGNDAITKCEEEHFDIILMDIMMPKMNGIETLEKLKEDKDFNTPVVALTADALEGQEDKYIQAGFNSYLSKPINQETLKKTLQQLIKN